MAMKPDPEKVSILVDKIGAIMREHIKAAGGLTPADKIEAAKECLNGLGSVAAFVVTGLPSSAQAYDFFLDAFRTQVAANAEHKLKQPIITRFKTK